ncbi:helix-turn-helix domain-containing protein [Acidiphilium sp. AL]|nr:helix-turn-helix domain-containing protein [Acidiphilium sp. AL]MCU4159357.1 helix-turn-helix domain-containing protein [Acidiphilium sp. AL]
MSPPIALRSDFTAVALRGHARRTRDANQARRLLALASIYDGAQRSEAARIGGVGVQIIRDWVVRFNEQGPDGLINRKGTVERERALGGLFLTLAEPTREMAHEAAAAGFFETSFGRHPKLQIVTVAQLMTGMRPDLPGYAPTEGFRRAPRESGPDRQGALDV